jgi:hypothetical protein
VHQENYDDKAEDPSAAAEGKDDKAQVPKNKRYILLFCVSISPYFVRICHPSCSSLTITPLNKGALLLEKELLVERKQSSDCFALAMQK